MGSEPTASQGCARNIDGRRNHGEDGHGSMNTCSGHRSMGECKDSTAEVHEKFNAVENDVRVEDQSPEPTSWLRSFREKAPSRREDHDHQQPTTSQKRKSKITTKLAETTAPGTKAHQRRLRSFREKAPSRRGGHDVVEIHVQKIDGHPSSPNS